MYFCLCENCYVAIQFYTLSVLVPSSFHECDSISTKITSNITPYLARLSCLASIFSKSQGIKVYLISPRLKEWMHYVKDCHWVIMMGKLLSFMHSLLLSLTFFLHPIYIVIQLQMSSRVIKYSDTQFSQLKSSPVIHKHSPREKCLKGID